MPIWAGSPRCTGAPWPESSSKSKPCAQKDEARRSRCTRALAVDLGRAYGVETRVAVADLATEEGVRALALQVSDLPIGIAILNDADISRIEGIAGSPSYMAPEQIQSADITPASDVYSR